MDSTETYRYQSFLLTQAFDEALDRRDGLKLTEIFFLVADLISQLIKTLKRKYGGHSTMGAKDKYSWNAWLPAEVMADLKNAAEIDGDWIRRAKTKLKIRKLSKKAQSLAQLAVKALEQDLRTRIRDGRKWMNDRWPGWWTPEVAQYFHEWL
jgi:hypothetical protein